MSDSYIGRIRKVSGPGKSYLIKIDGNTSLAFDDLNLSGTSGGLATMQIVATDGVIDIKMFILKRSLTETYTYLIISSRLLTYRIYTQKTQQIMIFCAIKLIM